MSYPSVLDPKADQMLQPQIRLIWAIQSTILFLMLSTGAIFLLRSTLNLSWWTLLLALPLAVLLATLHARAAYQVARFGLTGSTVHVVSGMIFRKSAMIPRTRIQYVDVEQGPIERRFALGTLKIHTAGTSHAVTEISGLPFDLAQQFRDDLLRDLIGEADVV